MAGHLQTATVSCKQRRRAAVNRCFNEIVTLLQWYVCCVSYFCSGYDLFHICRRKPPLLTLARPARTSCCALAGLCPAKHMPTHTCTTTPPRPVCSWDKVPPNKYKGCQLKKWLREVAAKNQLSQNVKDESIALLERMLCLDPAKRLSAVEAFQVRWRGGGGAGRLREAGASRLYRNGGRGAGRVKNAGGSRLHQN